MLRSHTLLLACGFALMAGCAHNKCNKPTTQKTTAATASESIDTVAAIPAPAVATDHLAGAWQLAIPRKNAQQATITATDDTHITIKAGDLSGNYLVQGKYLLILTHDERLRPLAWKINSADSLTVVRSPEAGDGASDYTGVTLVRAAGDATASTSESASASTDSESQASTNEQASQ